jgi:hypothetical protein
MFSMPPIKMHFLHCAPHLQLQDMGNLSRSMLYLKALLFTGARASDPNSVAAEEEREHCS